MINPERTAVVCSRPTACREVAMKFQKPISSPALIAVAPAKEERYLIAQRPTYHPDLRGL